MFYDLDVRLQQMHVDMEEQSKRIISGMSQIGEGQKRDQAQLQQILESLARLEKAATTTAATTGVNVTEALRTSVAANLETRTKTEQRRSMYLNC